MGKHRLRWKRIAVLGLVLAYLLIVPTGCITGWLVLGENHQTVDPQRARQEMLRVDGRALECWIARSPGAKQHEPVAFSLLFTGKGDRVERWITDVANAWGDRPVEVWGMNYPGSGKSAGPVKLKWVTPSALAMYDAVRKVAGARPIFAEGASFGTVPVLSVAARRGITGMIIHNPPPLRQLILGNYGWWNLWLLAGPISMQIPGDLDSVVNAGKASAPAIFILSDADEVIPPLYHQLVVDAFHQPKRIIKMPGAFHDAALPREAAEQLEHDRDWLWKSAGL